VIPGSHRAYHQKDDPPREAVTLFCRAGDVLLMRPLVTHASGHSKTSAALHRRIVHLECAADAELPDDYAWKWFAPIAEGEPGAGATGRRALPTRRASDLGDSRLARLLSPSSSSV